MEHKHIHWLGHASFRIQDGLLQIYIDPWKLPANSPKADIILITHAHYDHFSLDDINQVKKETTLFFAPNDVFGESSVSGSSELTEDSDEPLSRVVAPKLKGSKSVLPDGKYEVGEISLNTVPAYNLGKDFHPKKNMWVGYIITLSNGQRIYHSGDTDAIPEMRSVSTDVALLPCGGTYTMAAKEAGAIANIFKPLLVIPMHWGDIVGSKQDAEEVQRVFKGETIIKSPER